MGDTVTLLNTKRVIKKTFGLKSLACLLPL